MEDLVAYVIKKIIDGNIAAVIISTIAVIGCIGYLFLQIHNKSTSTTNELSDQVENSINLIVELIKELQRDLLEFIKESRIEFKNHDIKFSKNLEDIELEIVKIIDDLDHNLLNTITSTHSSLVANINDNTSARIENLENVLNRDLLDIRLQRKEIKELLENNIKDVKFRLDILQDMVKNNEINNSASIMKINHLIEALKQSIEISNLVSNNLKGKD